jgi:fatty acid desaturase
MEGRPSKSTGIAWPTVAVGLTICLVFGLLTWFHRIIPTPLLVIALGLTSAWHGSLQHELLHGLVFSRRTVSTLFGAPTMNLWLPFSHYRQTHLQHHRDEHLTDPTEDPESWYRHPDNWAALGPVMRGVLWWNRTLAGRMTVGPFLAVFGYLRTEMRSLVHGSRISRRRWSRHLVAVAITSAWVFAICRVPVWKYLLGATYLGSSVTLVRSYIEHRWLPNGAGRTAMVMSRGPLALLFLNNNLHLAHHLRSDVRWYELPAVARELRCDEAAAAGAGTFRGYRQVLRAQMFRPLCQPVHPEQVGEIPKPVMFRRNPISTS